MTHRSNTLTCRNKEHIMNIEKTLISVIVAFGIVGSAALAAGGKAEISDFGSNFGSAKVTASANDCINGGLFASHDFDSHSGALDL
jgi:hypothetical protein